MKGKTFLKPAIHRLAFPTCATSTAFKWQPPNARNKINAHLEAFLPLFTRDTLLTLSNTVRILIVLTPSTVRGLKEAFRGLTRLPQDLEEDE